MDTDELLANTGSKEKKKTRQEQTIIINTNSLVEKQGIKNTDKTVYMHIFFRMLLIASNIHGAFPRIK